MRNRLARLAMPVATAVALSLFSLMLPPGANAANPAPPEIALDAKASFDAAGANGTMLVYDMRRQRMLAYNPQRARTAYSPASTFKIFNSLIGLETGAVADVDNDKLPWDGKLWTHNGTPILPAVCNGDVSLRLALKNSCVPAYQVIARRVGTAQYRKFLTAAHFGNADVSGPVDRFWLNDHLRITAYQQIDFLRAVVERKVPGISARSYDALDDILTIEQTPDYTLRAKTGWRASGKNDIGWWVGWVTRGQDTYVFAMNLDMPRIELAPKRQEIGRAVLKQVGALP
ncbi:penicillin-binding transpeptidase domain-containing protein [Cupriavidus sp. YR651]|uniref:OXA-1206 family carbapenem-hydrolyzing class D beta-lactamase n=1 Tax=Cupriavidus sp. YR651 TaxID=1855315 RepID=UPI000B826531|nr:penicillin-binding transpeptidase domain-containing protein [Cupriavidus sp. YR651]